MNAISGPPFRIPDLTIPEETVSDQLDAAARAFPDRVAVDFMRDTRTFAQLERDVARAARALLDVGVRRGDRVAIAMPNCTTHLVVFYAVLRLGAIVVEHNPTYTADQLRHQLSDSGAQVAVVWEPAAQAAMDARTGTSLRAVIAVDLTRDLPRSSRAALRLPVRAAREGRRAMRAPVPPGALRWHRLLSHRTLPHSHPRPAPGDVALLQYTGGTTGTPKGAVLTHRNLVTNAVQCELWTSIRPGTEVFYAPLPFFHAFGLTLCMVLAIRSASTLVVFPRFDPAAVISAQKRRPAPSCPQCPR